MNIKSNKGVLLMTNKQLLAMLEAIKIINEIAPSETNTALTRIQEVLKANTNKKSVTESTCNAQKLQNS